MSRRGIQAWCSLLFGAFWGISMASPASVIAAARPAQPNPHWAFQPIVRPPLPQVRSQNWVANPIDAFVAQHLESQGVSPSPSADASTLIRRLNLDLTGLPPSAEQVRRFVADPNPSAYERLVDVILESPHFGEQWGRHWLDLARYADSDGYEKDTVRPWAWRYRDWVIEAINDDMPFDQFTREQLAGDLLENASLEQKVATGLHRNTLTNKEGGVDQEEFRCKAVVDRVNTTGTIWLGLTVGCAECHDHKYDPISQKEYYQLFACFNNADESNIAAPRPEEWRRYQEALASWREDLEHREKALADYENTELPLAFTSWLESNQPAGTESHALDELPDEIASILRQPETPRTPTELDALAAYHRNNDPRWVALRKSIDQSKKTEPPAPETQAQTLVKAKKTRATHVHVRGDFLRPGEEVQPGTPSVLPPWPAKPEREARRSLAEWLIQSDNPLTARVAVNRIWQHLFGKGLVATPEDFGARGSPPTHPELLDWLATEFVRLGWSRKALIRLIVTSNTYRQSSRHRPELQTLDPLNHWLARQNRFRLASENVRDSALAACGLLHRTVGGPSIRPPLPADIAALGYANSVKWQESPGPKKYRRGLYILFQRTVPYPMLTTFDAPDSNTACTRRERSNTPLQALTLLNDPVFYECAVQMAQRVMGEFPQGSPETHIDRMFEHTVSRLPTAAERTRLRELYDQQRILAESPGGDLGTSEITSSKEPTERHDADTLALISVSRVVLNLDEFITRE